MVVATRRTSSCCLNSGGGRFSPGAVVLLSSGGGRYSADVVVLFEQRWWPLLADGTVTVAFRRWRRPTVKAGGRLTTPVGVLAIDSLAPTTEAEITDGDARRAGYESAEAVRRELAVRSARPDDRRDLYRVEFHVAGPDPRIELREQAQLTDADVVELARRLGRLDAASTHGPWTAVVLDLIDRRPGVRAGDLADAVGRERLAFKADVRKLKALGLTESLDVGYRLSPRGRAWLDRR